jgi:hypothetical protein
MEARVAPLQDRVFEPRYPRLRSVVAGVSLLPGAVLLAVVLAMHVAGPMLSLAGLLVILPPLVLRAQLLRRVVFGEHLVVFRYLLTDRYVKYAELYRIRKDGIDTAHGFVRFAVWTNRKAFLELLTDLRDAGRLQKTRMDPGILTDG